MMFDPTEPKRDPQVERLIRESDELSHISRELTKKSLTKERIRELMRTSNEIARNCERLLGLLHSNNH